MRRFYGIVGPESSGTRIMSAIFVRAGCFGDAPRQQQRIDKVVYENVSLQSLGIKSDDDIVLRRSVPYGSEWPDLIGINSLFTSKGYRPLWIMTLRDYFCNAKSKIKQGHKTDMEAAYISLFKEIKFIMGQIIAMNVPFYIFDTSLLFDRKERAMKRLSEITGLTFDCSSVVNSDLQYLQ